MLQLDCATFKDLTFSWLPVEWTVIDCRKLLN